MNKKIIIAIAALVIVGGGAGAFVFLSSSEGPIVKVSRGFVEPPDDGTEVTDPVAKTKCKKTFSTKSAVYEQRTYYFCCPHCPKQFIANMSKFADDLD